MVHPYVPIEFGSSAPRATGRAIQTILLLCSCAALTGLPARAAERQALAVEQGPAARESGIPAVDTPVVLPGLTVRLATPEKGIKGQVRGGGTSIFFRSWKANGAVTAYILGADGAVLYAYRDFNGETMKIVARDGSRIKLRRPPELRVQGILYGSSTPEQLAALQSLATSREGRLIRRLGLELFLAAPGRDLVDERRGLELATQALWPYFLPGSLPALPLTVDYEVGPQGYLVLSQPYDLVLATNRVDSELPREKHSDHQVNDCFGRCGSGCTGGFAGIPLWPSQWTDTYGSTFIYKQEVWCESGNRWLYTWYATPTTHSVDGWWTPGCQLHDNCCRLNPLLCITVCNGVAPLAPLSDPLGEVRTWTYTDYSWSIHSDSLGSGCTCPEMAAVHSKFYECRLE